MSEAFWPSDREVLHCLEYLEEGQHTLGHCGQAVADVCCKGRQKHADATEMVRLHLRKYSNGGWAFVLSEREATGNLIRFLDQQREPTQGGGVGTLVGCGEGRIEETFSG